VAGFPHTKRALFPCLTEFWPNLMKFFQLAGKNRLEVGRASLKKINTDLEKDSVA
jgi:hypothetical protein